VRIHSPTEMRMNDALLDFVDAPKKATNLSLNSKVLEAARELGINISQTVDDLLAREVRRRAIARWVAENGAIVDAYNRRIDTQGLWNADLRALRGQI
jgi:antitoxin CcdA